MLCDDLEEEYLDCDHADCWNLSQAQADELWVFDATNSAEIQLKCFVFIISLDIVEWKFLHVYIHFIL